MKGAIAKFISDKLNTDDASKVIFPTKKKILKINAYWRAAKYFSLGQIYLIANPLLREPLKIEHFKPRLLGIWGTTPGLNFICVHLNRLIKECGLNLIHIYAPGHGGPGRVAIHTSQVVILKFTRAFRRTRKG